MARRKSLSFISLAQVVAFIGLILAGYFIFGFAKVALVGHELRTEKAALQAEVDALAAEVATLEAKRDFVQTDEYIEQAAREEFKMSRPGDQVVVPMFRDDASEVPQETPQPTEAAPAPPSEPWRDWWELFFGP